MLRWEVSSDKYLRRIMDDLNQIEADLKESDQKKRKTPHKVSGKSVFKLKEIIQEKGQEVSQKNISESDPNE